MEAADEVKLSEPVAAAEKPAVPATHYVATAYSLRGRTASGWPVSKGIIAADPRVLPLGSRVKIEAGPYSGEYLVAEGEICWGGMHSWREMVKLLETVDRPGTVGYQADMAHSMLYTLGYNREEDRILPKDFDWSDRATLDDMRAARSLMA